MLTHQATMNTPDSLITGTKTCTKCGAIKPITDFYLRNATRYRFQHRDSACKECVKTAERTRKPKAEIPHAPCEHCERRAHCAKTGQACGLFNEYVQTGQYTRAHAA